MRVEEIKGKGYMMDVVGGEGENGMRLEVQVYKQKGIEERVLESQMSKIVRNEEIKEEIIDVDEASNRVTGYLVVRKRLTMTLKQFLEKEPNLSPLLKYYLRKQMTDKLNYFHHKLNVY